jgi:hypothetical protein
MGRRNWCSIRWDQKSGELSFDIRVEREKGVGETVGCVCFPFALAWVVLNHLIHFSSAAISSRHLHPAGAVDIERALGSSASTVPFFFHAPQLYRDLDAFFFPFLIYEVRAANWGFFRFVAPKQKYHANFPCSSPVLQFVPSVSNHVLA